MRFHQVRGPLVADVTRGRVRFERGDTKSVFGPRVALIAQFSMSEQQPRSLSEYTRALSSGGFTPVVISTCESPLPLTFPYGIADDTVIIRRPNEGYDFGSWATALGVLPGIRHSDVVLLTNDSLMGPFAPITGLLDWVSAPGPDIRALTSSYQFVRHMQSYFLAFRGGILADPPWEDFFNGVRIEPDKMSIVLRYELGVSRTAFSEGYSTQEYMSGPELGVPSQNPTIDGWRQLLERGVPFVKRTMVTDPSTVKEANEVREYVKRRYHTDVNQW